ncbi:MAG: hypothetical protein BHW48_09675 [Roseburia sp. CAG:10041_57]|nr:MAG: hypothetical protein BHW48_09675 [Roseburia sp. CAG:10041_57]
MAYIAVCLFADEPFERVEDYTKYMNDKFTQPELTSVKYLRKIDELNDIMSVSEGEHACMLIPNGE